MECVLTASGTLHLEGYKLTALLREWEGELLSPRRQSSARRGNKGSGKCHLLRPSPSQNPKGNQFLPGNLLAPRKHPTLCFCGSIPPTGLPLSWCYRAPPAEDHRWQSELSLPLLPPCTLPTHPS